MLIILGINKIIKQYNPDVETMEGAAFIHAANEIKCEMLDDAQWLVLEQIEVTLAMIAGCQRILEGEKYPTGSFVVSAIYAIHVHFLDSEHAHEPVKSLTRTLT